MKIGIIKEGKIPPDFRVVLTPKQCAQIQLKYPVKIIIQSSHIRCYSDSEYLNYGISVEHDLSACDILLGVKEVPIDLLISGKTYFFFSHTIKKQVQNRRLLQAILEKNIRLIDFEALKDPLGNRLIAFGKFAGMVGGHNALWVYSKRTNSFQMKRIKEFKNYDDARRYYKTLKIPPVKIVLTGTGRVATGAKLVLEDLGIKEISSAEFLTESFEYPVYSQIDSSLYVARRDLKPFSKHDFYNNPQDYISTFHDYTRVADIMINGIYWNQNSPPFFSKEEMKSAGFKIRVIADISCDIAPNSSIPATLRASSIENPVYGYNPLTEEESLPYKEDSIDIMAIDNLPNELPRDASKAFGNQFIDNILPELLKEKSAVIQAATITESGLLKKNYEYLEEFVLGINPSI